MPCPRCHPRVGGKKPPMLNTDKSCRRHELEALEGLGFMTPNEKTELDALRSK